VPYQAVLQAGARPAHRDHHQRHLRLFSCLRTLGQRINIRLVAPEQVAHYCGLGEPQFATLVLPGQTPDGQLAGGLKFGQPRVLALLAALRLFGLTAEWITNGRLRLRVIQLPGVPETAYTPPGCAMISATSRARDSPAGRPQALLRRHASRPSRGPVPDQALRPGLPAGLPGVRLPHRLPGPTPVATTLHGCRRRYGHSFPGGATRRVGLEHVWSDYDTTRRLARGGLCPIESRGFTLLLQRQGLSEECFRLRRTSLASDRVSLQRLTDECFRLRRASLAL